jgi:hypothetical protein
MIKQVEITHLNINFLAYDLGSYDFKSVRAVISQKLDQIKVIKMTELLSLYFDIYLRERCRGRQAVRI